MNAEPRLPLPGTDDNLALADLIEEFTAQVRSGEPVDMEAFIEAHPAQAERLRRLLPGVLVLADLGLSQPEGEALEVAAPNALLGDFRILREVGRGGMGIVYEAEQVSLGRRVALKVLPFAAMLDPRRLQRFQNEVRAAASLHHEHIVPVYAVGCERAVHFYAMQLIQGKSLAELSAGQASMSRGRQAPELAAEPATRAVAAASTEAAPRDTAYFRRIAAWGIQAAEALEHAHALGIVHRDIKPANLIVDGPGKLWITDFGLARTATDAGLTMSGDLLGTLRYMSPEQALARHGLVDHRTDVYSLGATLYELLTGRRAVEGKDREVLLRRIADDEPRPPRALERGIPPDLETIVLKALAKEPADRYATAKELADDLRRFLEDKPIRARRPTLAQRLRKWGRRHRHLVGATALFLALALVGLVCGVLWHNTQLQAAGAREREQAEQARHERDVAEEERRWVRRAADDLYTQVAETWLSRQPRLQPVQREFLEKALHFYQHIAQQDNTRPSLRHATALAHYRLGKIQLKLGRADEAGTSFRRAIELFEMLVAQVPREASYLQNLSKSYLGLGEALQKAGHGDEARRAYQACIDRCRKLLAEFPARPEYQRDLAAGQAGLAMILADAGKIRDAEQAYQEAEEAFQKLVQAFPGQPDYRFGLANAHNNLANLLVRTGRAQQAEPVYRQAIAALKQLAEDQPSEPEYRARWAYNLSTLAATLPAKRAGEASPFIQQAVVLLQRLADDFPAVPDYQWELACCHGNLGIVRRRLHDFAGAEQSYGQAIATFHKVVVRFPDVPAYRREMGVDERNLGNLLGESLKRPKEAEEAYRRALEIQLQLVAGFATVPTYRSDLADTYDNLAALLRRTGQLRKAEESLSQALPLWEDLAASAPGNAGYRGALARTCKNLALVLVWHQSPPCPHAARAVALAKRAIALEPKAANPWISLGVAHYRAGNWKDSSEALQKGRELGAPYEAAGGWFAAMTLWQLGNQEEARRRYREAAQEMDPNKPQSDDLRRFRAEAAQLLGIED
jgi:serine/threonine protein kinase